MTNKKNKELRGLRAKNDMTLVDMGELLDIHPETYRLKEKGSLDFTTSEVNKILSYFNVKYEDIFLPTFPQKVE